MTSPPKRLPALIACGVALAFISQRPAQAQTVTLTLDNIKPALGDTFAAGHAGYVNFSGVDTGPVDFTVTGETGLPQNPPAELELFGAVIQPAIPSGSRGVFSLVNMNLDPDLGILYAHVFGSTYDPSLLTDTQLAALQIAVWKIFQGNGLQITPPLPGPNFWITSTTVGGITTTAANSPIVTDAQAWLDWVRQNPNAPEMALEGLKGAGMPVFLVPTEAIYATAIPEPSDWALGIGTAALGMVLWRRRRDLISVPALK